METGREKHRSVSGVIGEDRKMKRVKTRMFAGAVCEIAVWNQAEGEKPSLRVKRDRFASAEQYEEFKEAQARRKFVQLVNANHGPSSLEGVLTFDDENELYNFRDARRVRSAYVRRIRRKAPDAKIIIVMGRGNSTARIHFHFIMGEVAEEAIRECWTWGMVVECEHLRAHNYRKGVDHGMDYEDLANYLWKHWTPEQGGHHYYATRNHIRPKPEEPVEIKREYTVDKPPRAPKGYVLVESKANIFGYLYFKYVKLVS